MDPDPPPARPPVAATWPVPERAERIADGVMHGAGLAFALIGATLLVVFAALHAGGGQAAAVAIYAGALVATFLASASYHLAPWHGAREALRRLDHAAIFLKIAGTYTPLVALLGSAFAWVVLAGVWAVALGGAILKLAFWRDPGRLGLLLYLLLGWTSLLLVWPLAATLPLAATILVVAGGMLYTAGAAVFARHELRFSTAIWHGFVLAASGCFFAAIAVGTFTSA